MSTYKLTFYNVPATAEVSRMLFFLAGVEFEDNRLEFNSKEWKELKPSKNDNISWETLKRAGVTLTEVLAFLSFLPIKRGLRLLKASVYSMKCN